MTVYNASLGPNGYVVTETLRRRVHVDVLAAAAPTTVFQGQDIVLIDENGDTWVWNGLQYVVEASNNTVESRWGSIQGTLSDQTDLQTELNAKANIAHSHVANSIPNSELATMASNTISGNNSGAPATRQDLTATQVKALLAIAAADITDASANGKSLLTAANYAAMRTLLSLVVGTNVQAWSTLLDTIAALPATVGLLEKTGATTIDAVRVIGTSTDTSIPTWGNVLTNQLRVIDATDMSAVSGNPSGRFAITMQEPNAGVVWKSNGAAAPNGWDRQFANSGTFAEMQAVASPYDGQRWFVTTIDFGGSLSAFPLRSWYTYDGVNLRWVADAPMSYSILADTTSVTNDALTVKVSHSIVFPLKFITQYMHVSGWIHAKRTSGTVGWRPVVAFGGTTIIDQGTAIDNGGSTQNNMRGLMTGDCRSTNTLRLNAGATHAWDESNGGGSGVAISSITADGVTSLDFGFIFSATGSNTNGQFDQISLIFTP